MAGQQAGGAGSRSLRFNPLDDRGRRPLTRERVVAEALAVISAEGAQALTAVVGAGLSFNRASGPILR
jgi:hypothetical protein